MECTKHSLQIYNDMSINSLRVLLHLHRIPNRMTVIYTNSTLNDSGIRLNHISNDNAIYTTTVKSRKFEL